MNNQNIPNWKCGKNIYATTRVNSWHEFVALLETDFMDWSEYIFRGQKDATWPLRSKFDRDFRNAKGNIEEKINSGILDSKVTLDERTDILMRLYQRFQKACSGRRGPSPKELNSDEWWALGQHFGLATPLLDWSKSPYVAAFFAINEPAPDELENRAIWVFTQIGMTEVLINQSENLNKNNDQIKTITVIDAVSDENSRIISQNGLFTMTPKGDDIEEFIEENLELNGMGPVLFKIEIPNSLRENFLRHLDYMNINDASLFPDLIGAAQYANRYLERESTDLIWEAQPEHYQRLMSKNIYHGNDKE